MKETNLEFSWWKIRAMARRLEQTFLSGNKTLRVGCVQQLLYMTWCPGKMWLESIF